MRLIRKISKTQGILPLPYILRKEDIHVGEIRDKGGFGVVSDGEYQGNTVAIKHIKMDGKDPDKIFKVTILGQPPRSLLSKFSSAIVSGGNCLETRVTSEHLALARGFYLH